MNLRKYRNIRGYTQMKLAELSGVSQIRISQIENGGGYSVKTAMKLANALNVKLDALVTPQEVI